MKKPYFPLMTLLLIIGTLTAHFSGYGHWAFQWSTTLASWSNLLDLFRYMISHGSLDHLSSNMMFLLLLGPVIEKRLGHVRFLVLYITSGLAAALGYGFIFQGDKVIGASGAIAGLIAVYPFVQRNLVSFFLGGILLGLYFIKQFDMFLLNYLLDGLLGSTAFLAHVAGGLWGLIFFATLAWFRQTR